MPPACQACQPHSLNPNFFNFHAVTDKIWPNNRLTPPLPVWEILDPPLHFLPPANEVCEGYVFTGVCLSTGGACTLRMPPRHAHPLGPEHAPPGTYAPLADTTRCGQWADGTHPTGMHSCLIPLVSLFFVFRFTAHREIKRLFFVLKRLKRDLI